MKTRISILNPASASRAHSVFLGAIAVLLAGQSAHAASGTWTNTVTDGLWSDTANWNLATIADGADFTADFSTLDIAADNTVHLDSARTIGKLIFGDATTPSNNWVVDNNTVAGNILTLATAPAITVSNQSATLGLVLAGSNGFTKAGSGELILTGANTLGGDVSVTGGTLSIGIGTNNTATAGSGRIVMGNGTTFRLNSSASPNIFLSNSIVISGANANATITSASLSNAFGGTVSGSSDQTLTIGNSAVSFNGTTQQLANFAGTLSLASGTALRFSTTTTSAVGSPGTELEFAL